MEECYSDFVGVRTKHGQGSMDPLFGPGLWTIFVDRVHGPPVIDQVHGLFFLSL